MQDKNKIFFISYIFYIFFLDSSKKWQYISLYFSFLKGNQIVCLIDLKILCHWIYYIFSFHLSDYVIKGRDLDCLLYFLLS